LRSAVDFLGAEEGEAKPGYIALAQHLAGLIFVSLVRAYVLHATEQPRGWLRGLTDKRIAQALTAMHGTPGQAWSVATLAAQAALSRAAFAARFHELIGQTPMAYLTAWRMYLAAERLSRGAVKISQLTEESGYRSERAFRQAFKRHIGQTPRDCKKSARPREDSARKPL
jgi:transcriptional regulator GlxA family with amidase domain